MNSNNSGSCQYYFKAIIITIKASKMIYSFGYYTMVKNLVPIKSDFRAYSTMNTSYYIYNIISLLIYFPLIQNHRCRVIVYNWCQCVFKIKTKISSLHILRAISRLYFFSLVSSVSDKYYFHRETFNQHKKCYHEICASYVLLKNDMPNHINMFRMMRNGTKPYCLSIRLRILRLAKIK